MRHFWQQIENGGCFVSFVVPKYTLPPVIFIWAKKKLHECSLWPSWQIPPLELVKLYWQKHSCCIKVVLMVPSFRWHFLQWWFCAHLEAAWDKFVENHVYCFTRQRSKDLGKEYYREFCNKIGVFHNICKPINNHKQVRYLYIESILFDSKFTKDI